MPTASNRAHGSCAATRSVRKRRCTPSRVTRRPSRRCRRGGTRRDLRPAIDAGDDLPLTVGALLRERAAERGSAALLVTDDDTLTYAEADARSATLARALLAAGAGHGTHVGLLHPNGTDFVVGWLAAARIGAVTIPLSTFSTSHELAGLLSGADVEILLERGRLPVARLRGHVVAGDRGARPGRDRHRSSPPPCPRCGGSRSRRWRPRPTGAGSMDALVEQADRVDAVRAAGGRRSSDARGPHGDRPHIGVDQRAEGRDPHPRRA